MAGIALLYGHWLRVAAHVGLVTALNAFEKGSVWDHVTLLGHGKNMVPTGRDLALTADWVNPTYTVGLNYGLGFEG